MPSYVVTGASRGLGYAFVKHLAAQPNNTVIGLARNKAATDKLLAKDGITNVHIFQADITDAQALKAAASETAKITGGSLDVLINNAAFVNEKTGNDTLKDMLHDEELYAKDFMTHYEINVVGVMKTINAFLPLIEKGELKKVITISTGMADLEMMTKYDVAVGPAYAASKAATNILVQRYQAAYKEDGILFMSISPGYVDTDHASKLANMTEKQLANVQKMAAAFAKAAPDFKGAITPEESVEKVLSVIDNASLKEGWGASFVSHHGNNKEWL